MKTRWSKVALGVCALLFASATTGHAVLGETLDQLKARLGRPQPTEAKNTAVWLIEVIDGVLIYNVTFNAKGESIAEGLKPNKRARFTPDLAENFIGTQTRAHAGSPTLREIKPGEHYRFAGRNFSCRENEHVIVDDTRGLLIVWTKAPIPSVMAVSKEMLVGPSASK